MDDKPSKYRYFAGFVYKHDKEGKEQVSREGVIEALKRSFGDFAVSPWHKADDEQTDDHLHIVYRHPSTVYIDPAKRFMLSIEGVKFFNDYIIALHHPSNYQRYLVHADNPDKEQFEGGFDEITLVNNFPLNTLRELSLVDKMQIQREIEGFAVEFSIFEYSSMALYLSKSQDLLEHYIYFTTHTHHFGKFLDSLRYCASQRKEADLDV